ncbi:hypothetical protein Tco_1027745 [Tanacetum coccineum]
MFLAVVARPRFDMSGHEIFSGKIGIFPFTTLEPAKRSSKNHVAGTLETKPILSVTKDVTRSWLIHKVLSAIRAKWPQGHTGPIFIQQDNAKPHIDVNDAEFLQEVRKVSRFSCKDGNDVSGSKRLGSDGSKGKSQSKEKGQVSGSKGKSIKKTKAGGSVKDKAESCPWYLQCS